MRFTISIFFIFLMGSFALGQGDETKWYSETEVNGILIQNSLPKGGPYTGPTKKYFNYSYLVFFTRITNQTEQALELDIHFAADSIAIPNSPDTFMKLFLPSDTMSRDKQQLFSYGITELESLDDATSFQKKLKPKEECYFRVVAIFYQNKAGLWSQKRGGNRAELVLKGTNLFYRMPPQIDSLACGEIILREL